MSMMTFQSRGLAWLAASVTATLLCAASVRAQAPEPAPTATGEDADIPQVPHEKYVLQNGLEVILHPDRRVPLVAVSVWYHVGSGNETPGRSGFAHLFEHMMFQGSRHVGEDAHFDVLKKIGASMINGTTNPDRTNYFEVVPAHQLDTALWLESDRMGYLLPLLTQKSLDNQRDVVRNERRQSYDNVPYGKERFKLHELLYPEGHPYRYMTIGRHEDLQQASVADVRAFFQKWYVPSNATLTLAGDFEPADARRLVERWFGSFPKAPRPQRQIVPAPQLAASQRAEIRDPFARLRRVHFAWHSPRLYAPGDAELDLLAHALGQPGTGRLYKLLVHEKQWAQNVAVYQGSAGFSSVFHVIADLRPETELAEVERLIDAEIDRVVRAPLTSRELARALASVEASFVWELESLLPRAEILQTYNHFLGTPDWIAQDLARYRKASIEAIRAAAAEALPPERRVEVITLPAERGAP